jgi:hypothetical protein
MLYSCRKTTLCNTGRQVGLRPPGVPGSVFLHVRASPTDTRQGSDTWPNWMKNVVGPSKLFLGSLPWRVKQEARQAKFSALYSTFYL